jgi:hypothetical protein
MTIRRMLAATLVAATSALPAALVAADAPAALAKGKTRSAVGHTKQGRKVRIRVGGSSLRMLHFTAKLKCRDGSLLIDKESGFQETPLKRGSRFDDVQYGSSDTVRFRGKVTSTWVRGRLRVQDRWGKVKCDSKWVKFSAKVSG